MIEESFDIALDVHLLPYKLLKAGNMTCIYEAGNLRYIKCGSTEIVRMIYGAVRNENWDTIVPEITNEIVDAGDDVFYISYIALYNFNGIQYSANFVIEGKADSSISITMHGLALSDFKKNRIGLCVLHPLKETKGKPATIVEPSGDVYTAAFPELVSPDQPFKEIQQMQWKPAESMTAKLYFSGDIFETEDQRNWSDSSFKTYSTPQRIPFPVLVKKGDTMQQKIVLTVSGNSNPEVEKRPSTKIAVPTNTTSKIGYSMQLEQIALTGKQVKFFNENNVHHYRTELYLDRANWPQQLEKDVAFVAELGAKLELVLFFADKYDETFQLLLQEIKPVVQYIDSVLLLDKKYAVTPAALMEKGYGLMKDAFPSVKIGYGTDAYFAALNRNRPGSLPHDLVSFSLMPQAHASDIRTIIENLESMPDIMQTIQSFTNKAIHVSPVSIGKRINPDAVLETDYVITERDVREDSVFANDWKRLSLMGLHAAASVTIMQ
ncbi:MAG: hypothetical protein JWR61_3093 [Ferruginibacter sp.]|uniref:hypothetical protein n=1 Tax=Ferruginibacter sp. TaxID=1940288 RepID=UPI00265A887F|nr:hypothetical protein [Ferruginibacter sp.]MDB5278138.1 hypothetical protein [Ferruginibacter sp.]